MRDVVPSGGQSLQQRSPAQVKAGTEDKSVRRKSALKKTRVIVGQKISVEKKTSIKKLNERQNDSRVAEI